MLRANASSDEGPSAIRPACPSRVLDKVEARFVSFHANVESDVSAWHRICGMQLEHAPHLPDDKGQVVRENGRRAGRGEVTGARRLRDVAGRASH